ncbi:MAG: hypothetical protein U0166_10830 [Acidobacteriota bacterium]
MKAKMYAGIAICLAMLAGVYGAMEYVESPARRASTSTSARSSARRWP